MRSHFERQLKGLQEDLVTMGRLAVELLSAPLHHLGQVQGIDMEGIGQTYQQLEELEGQIENKCIKLLLRQQPVARDLRMISSILKMVYDLKRIGLQSVEVMELLAEEAHDGLEEVAEFEAMLTCAVAMVSRTLDAFVTEDAQLAEEVIAKDDEIDHYFGIIRKGLSYRLVSDETKGDQIVNWLMTAKYVEKVGDHAVNMARWILYMIRG